MTPEDEEEYLLGQEEYYPEYPDYTDDQIMVVSGPVGSARFPGRRFPSRKEAIEAHEGVCWWYCVPGRYFLGVRKTNGRS